MHDPDSLLAYVLDGRPERRQVADASTRLVPVPISHPQICPELCCHRLRCADRHHGSGRLRTAEAT